ncbi:MAG: serine hydrolase [Pseudomonadota bacterium]
MAIVAIAGAFALSAGEKALAAPYAAIVIDARNGEVLHSRSADKRLHPASLTKMMTLYLAFEAVKQGNLKLDTKVRVSRHARRQVPSKLYFSSKRRPTIRDLIRATAVKSANDAAVALGEAIAGSEGDFAKLMTDKAKRLGMKNTTFRNASGLSHKHQRSTARDMAILGRALFYDFPEYYNLFARKKTSAYGKTVWNTNRRLLASYRGADGIKTGYTNASGYNLVSSAKRGKKRVIAVVFGGRTSASRNRRIAELMDMGFARAKTNVAVVKPSRTAPLTAPPPTPRPGTAPAADLLADASRAIGDAIVPAAQASDIPIVLSEYAPLTAPAPKPKPGSTFAAAPKPRPSSRGSDETTEVASLGQWIVQLGVFKNEETAIAELASAALSDIQGLNSAGRAVEQTQLAGRAAYRAALTGFDRDAARSACRLIKAKGGDCLAYGPD